MTTFLTVDLGNSTTKLLLWEQTPSGGARPKSRRSYFTHTGPDAGLAAWLRSANPEGVALCCVAGEDPRRVLASVLGPCLEAPLMAPPEAGLDVACRSPETIGLDRLFAVRGAFEALRRSAVVVDAGTALTVDALRVEEGAARGAFLGGAIAPGPHISARALATAAHQLFEVEPDPDAAALGLDSREALCAGVSVGFRGAARELVGHVATEAGLPNADLVLTGGVRGFLSDLSAPGSGRLHVMEDLVHIGLLAAGLAGVDAEPWPVEAEG